MESNKIGIGEFYDWSKKAGTGIMGAVNMGTGTPAEAGELLEYCNLPGGTWYSELRKSHGHAEPFNIKTWCVGNEMDGPWQTCHLEAADYGKKARETAKIMKWIDDKIELVVCGSSTPLLPTYPEWDRIVLEHTYDQADFISLHRYYENQNNDDYLASFADMDNFIKAVCATADYVKALKRSNKTMFLSFDEWNIITPGKQKEHGWEYAPAIYQDPFSLLDALAVGGLGITLINNADRVKIACLAQLVNVLAPIFTVPSGPAIRQSIYWPFRDISVYGRGTVLKPLVKGPEKETCYGDVPIVPVAVVLDETAQILTIFVLNTDTTNNTEITLSLRSFSKSTPCAWSVLASTDLNNQNTPEKPGNVKPAEQGISNIRSDGNVHRLTLAKASWNVLRLKV
jgi:alpha-N-arabinofuranosidase